MDQVGGLTIDTALEAWDLPFDLGATDAERDSIRSWIANDSPVTTTNYGAPLFPFGGGKDGY